MNDLDTVADILSAQATLNQSVANALQSIALQSDRYDFALVRIHARLSDIEAQLQEAESEPDTFSRKVPS